MSNAKYLAFDTPNTKNQPPSDISNLKIFNTRLQYRLIFETVRKNVPKVLLLFYMLFLSPPQTYLFLRLVLSLRLVLFLNSHLCLALSVALSQPRRSHHSDHHAAPPSFVPSATSHHAAPSRLPYHRACCTIRHAMPHRRACHAIHPHAADLSKCETFLIFCFLMVGFFFFLVAVGFIAVVIG